MNRRQTAADHATQAAMFLFVALVMVGLNWVLSGFVAGLFTLLGGFALACAMILVETAHDVRKTQ